MKNTVAQYVYDMTHKKTNKKSTYEGNTNRKHNSTNCRHIEDLRFVTMARLDNSRKFFHGIRQ